MAIQLKMRYRYTSAGSWNYPPVTLRGVPATDTTSAYNIYALPSTLGNTMPALRLPINRISGNEIVNLVGSKKLEKDGGFSLEFNPEFIMQRIGNVDDEHIYTFLKLYNAAPLKQLGYNDGHNEILGDGSTLVIDVVSKQSMDVGKKEKGNRIGITLYLESVEYFFSDDTQG